MKTPQLDPSTAATRGASDADVFSTHSARYRLKSYLRARGGPWAAIALAEAGDMQGAVEVLQKARRAPLPR